MSTLIKISRFKYIVNLSLGMDRDAELWWKQSEHDFENAKRNLDSKQYYLTAFLVQQAVEKALKAL